VPSATALRDGVAVEVLQQRSDRTVERMRIRVENDGSEPLEIDAARLDAPASRRRPWRNADPRPYAPAGRSTCPSPCPASDRPAAGSGRRALDDRRDRAGAGMPPG